MTVDGPNIVDPQVLGESDQIDTPQDQNVTDHLRGGLGINFVGPTDKWAGWKATKNQGITHHRTSLEMTANGTNIVDPHVLGESLTLMGVTGKP
eukprot:scaffold16225_cov162-Cylindrotheca_fusiformis.AAC.1